MSNYTDLKTSNPFYGGISPGWGVGLHEEADTSVNPPRVEVVKADYLNRIEKRIDRLENIFNQMEHELLYPSGYINEDGIEDESISEDVPASGEYYILSRLDVISDALNIIIHVLIDENILEDGDIEQYPLNAGIGGWE